jgi:hypothetical protein
MTSYTYSLVCAFIGSDRRKLIYVELVLRDPSSLSFDLVLQIFSTVVYNDGK